MLEHLNELVDAGVSSIKIEGRNKKSLYVATVVNAYRHVLDGEDPAKWALELENVSHRPYSTGFYYGEAKQSPDYDGYEQNCVHVADVIDCKDCSGFFGFRKKFLIKVLCRNHFEQGEELEALVPGGDVLQFRPYDLKILKDKSSEGKNVDVANRAKEIYTFVSRKHLPMGSFLRSKTFLRTSRAK